MALASIIRSGVFVLCCSALLAAQNTGKTISNSGQSAEQTLPTPASPKQQQGDEFAQIRDDLNRMESLNLNMSSEIEFLHDQNLQILLRTNSQMWTVLIRDMRRQLERDEQRGATPAAAKK